MNSCSRFSKGFTFEKNITMKIAVTFQNGRSISGHAGRVHKFLIYTIENQSVVGKEVLELPKEQTFHSVFHDGVSPNENHPLYTVQALISGNMGTGFFNKMRLNNIDPLHTPEKDPDQAIEQLLQGQLEVVPVEAHHHHSDEKGHHHEHGQGHCGHGCHGH